MKVKMLRFTVAAGKDRAPGEKVDVTEKEARLLIGLGKAEEVKRGRPPKKNDGGKPDDKATKADPDDKAAKADPDDKAAKADQDGAAGDVLSGDLVEGAK